MIETASNDSLSAQWATIDPNSIQAEIEELHQFFQDWFRADVPNTDAAFARMDALNADFRIVIPNGDMLEREPLLQDFCSAYGKVPEIRIWVEDVVVHMVQDDLALATYIKRQATNEESSTRRSSVHFAVDPDAPNGLSWLHVHETWIERFVG